MARDPVTDGRIRVDGRPVEVVVPGALPATPAPPATADPCVEFTAYGEARPQGSKTSIRRGKHTVTVDDADLKTKTRPAGSLTRWRTMVADAAGKAVGDRPRLDGPLIAVFRFVIPRPKSHYGKRGLLPSAPSYPTVKPDSLKLARAVEDALTGIVYRDDAQIVAHSIRRVYGEPERVIVRIVPVEQEEP